MGIITSQISQVLRLTLPHSELNPAHALLRAATLHGQNGRAPSHASPLAPQTTNHERKESSGVA